MRDRHPYRYIRAYGRYVGYDRMTIARLVTEADFAEAPDDAYMKTADGRWVTLSVLDAQARGGSVVAADIARKVREYAGESLSGDRGGQAADTASDVIRAMRAL